MSIMSPSTNETSTIVSVWSGPAVPTPALPPNPSLIWQLLPGLRNMPPGTFFWAPTFLLIASVPYVATVHTLPETSSQVMPAAHCHISSSLHFELHTAHSYMRGREGGCSSLWVASGNKRWGIGGHAAQQKLSLCCSAEGKRKITGKVSEESLHCRIGASIFLSGWFKCRGLSGTRCL